MARRLAPLLVTVLLGGALSGCVPAARPAVSESGQPAEAASAGAIEQMSMADKSVIAEAFPVQVPVPAGTVLEGNAQGPDAWDYRLAMEQSPARVAEWYRERMTSANWQLLSSTERSDGGFNLSFVKAQAESRVEVTPDDGGSIVQVSIGLGAPVLQTQ